MKAFVRDIVRELSLGRQQMRIKKMGLGRFFKVSLTVFLITPAILLGFLKSRKQIKPKPIETVDGCIKIGKITFNKREVLGKGCDGTFVYRGEFEGRRVAVKRMIPECFEFATREVEMLRESDAHPNVVRYFCMEEDEQFHYIALELCQATLADYIQDLGKPEWVQIDKLNILMQATKGLNHLHTLKIIHRDIKPQNVLLSAPGPNGQVKAMISDFGLSKKLAVNKTSMSMRSGYAGTEGWIAPEILVANESITRAVDLFSLGCVYYYVLSNGSHPFGETFSRQANIKNGKCNLEGLVDNAELFKPLLKSLLSQDPRERPDCATVLAHPIFWTDSAVLSFLQDVSDRVEKSDSTDVAFRALETNAVYVVRGDWRVHIDHELSNDLRKYRSYRGNSLRDLLRALRNKKHHYHELTIESQQCLGEIPNEFIRYWTSRFPLLLIHTWLLMQVLRKEVNFKQYYLTNHRFSTYLIDYNMFANDAVQYRVDMDELNPIWAKSPPKSKTQKSQGLYRNLRHPNAMPPMRDKEDSTSSRPKFFKYNRHGKYKLNSKQAADVPLTWVLPKLPPSGSEATTK